jgi:hypothetical protein
MRSSHFGFSFGVSVCFVALLGLAAPRSAMALPVNVNDFEDVEVYNAANCDEVEDPETECGEEYLLDIDGDGEMDLSFFHYIDDIGPYADVIGLGPSFGNSMWWVDSEDFIPYANAFDEANQFGQTEALVPFALLFDEACGCGPSGNPWMDLNGATGYMGGIFEMLDNSFHQFWVAMSVDTQTGALNLFSAGWDEAEFAFEDLEEVPEPGTLALFGLGAAGLVVMRRRTRR